jgi:hypothetical protein
MGWALRRAAATVLTFHYVCFCWIFFRASSFDVARRVLVQIGTRTTDALNLRGPFLLALGLGVLAHLYPSRSFAWLRDRFVEAHPVAKAGLFVALAFALRALASPTVVPFIYFQF